MAITLVPYNNAMRLGQGFNSYTQQICIDDAVVVDPERAENVITNDGTTMRIMVEKSAAPSAWSRQPEVVMDDRATNAVKLEKAAEPEKPDEKPSQKTPQVAVEHPEKEESSRGEEQSAQVAMEKSDSGEVITHADAVPETTSEKVASIESKREPVAKSSTEGATAVGKATEKPSDKTPKEGSGPTAAPTPSPKIPSTKPRPRASSTGGQRKSSGAQKTEDEKARQKEDDERRRNAEQKKIEEQRKYQEKLEAEARQEDSKRREEDREEQRKIREEKRAFDAQRRADMRKAIAEAAKVQATSLEDLQKIAAQNQFADRFTGIFENKQEYTFDASGTRGPSQTVTYTSRFVDRLSDVTEDMCISGSLSIKAGKIGGSGKGSFVDSDKFKESDLNFYISVKVVNQTVNFKDALIYNPVPGGRLDEKKFKEIFGDTFISGFVEGGEFNALVSMKILNKAKKTDIQAEAKVALTAGPIDVEAQANVSIARSNLETNTETTIQVSWSGGGHIKPMEQQWDIQSLMQAAARFPDLVADCPQRTYAILTRYDTLRSFVALGPATFTPLQYENAQIYTNALLDAFMSYKSLYKTLGEQIFSIKGKTLEIHSWSDTETEPGSGTPSGSLPNQQEGNQPAPEKDVTTGLYPYKEDLSRFEASIKGLSDARVAIRRQMARIVNEVDLIEQSPKIATDEDHKEPFQSPLAFETRLPAVDVPERLRRRNNPLTGTAIRPTELSKAEQEKMLEEDEASSAAPNIYRLPNKLSKDEVAAMDTIRDASLGIGHHLKVTDPSGSDTQGISFNNLDILKPEWIVRLVEVHIFRGSVSYVGVTYENGLLIGKGVKHNNSKIVIFSDFAAGERVVSASVETGKRSNEPLRVTGLGLFTNRGRSLLATGPTTAMSGNKFSKSGVMYEEVTVTQVEVPLDHGTFKGFFGRSDDNPQGEGAIWRLGVVWGKTSGTELSNVEGKPLDLASVSDASKPQSGKNEPPSWDANKADNFARFDIRFSTSYLTPPLVLTGINKLDCPDQKPIAMQVRSTANTQEKMSFLVRSIGSPTYSPALSWLAIPSSDKHVESGVYEFVGDEPDSSTKAQCTRKVATIPFSKPFHRTPTSSVWLCGVGTGADAFFCEAVVECNASEFTVAFQRLTTSGPNFAGLRIGYFFYDPEECPNIQSGVIEGKIQDNKPMRKVEGRLRFPNAFKGSPAVWTVAKYFAAGRKKNLRLVGDVNNVREDGFDYSVGSWAAEGDDDMQEFAYTWIAIV